MRRRRKSPNNSSSPLAETLAREDDAALFIVAASSRLARTRAERLVVLGVETLRGDVSGTDQLFVDENRQPDGRLHVWSVRDSPTLANYWQRIRPGDWMAFYQMGFITIVARVKCTVESESVARGVWGPDEANDLRRIVAFDEVWPIWATVWPHRELIGARFLGFRRVAADKQVAIKKAYGSVESFVRKALVPHKRPPREHGGG